MGFFNTKFKMRCDHLWHRSTNKTCFIKNNFVFASNVLRMFLSGMVLSLYESNIVVPQCVDPLEDHQSILTETLSCHPPVLLRTNTSQKRCTHLTLFYSHHAKFQILLTMFMFRWNLIIFAKQETIHYLSPSTHSILLHLKLYMPSSILNEIVKQEYKFH